MINNVQKDKSFKTKIFNLMQQQSVSKAVKMGSKIKNYSPIKSRQPFDTINHNKFISHSFSQEKNIKTNSYNKNKFVKQPKEADKFKIKKSQSFKHLSTSKLNKKIQKQSQNKSYLLETLKTMQNVRKDLSKTFQKYQKSFIVKQIGKQSRKQKSKLSKINSKTLLKQQHLISVNLSSNKKLKTQHSKDIFCKQTPSKKHYTSGKKKNDEKDTSQKYKAIKLLRKHLTQPNKFIAIFKSESLIIYYRVVGKSLIQLQIHIEKSLDSLSLKLLKGNLQCQTLAQQYKNLRKKQIITLLSSVRSINLDQDIFNFPRLQIQVINQRQEQINTNMSNDSKQVVIPFPWIFLAQVVSQTKQKADSSLLQTSRIKNKSILQKIHLEENWIKYLNLFQLKTDKYNKYSYWSKFIFQNKEFKIQINTFPVKNKLNADLSLQGKGQNQMQKFITFIYEVLKTNKL